jgi:hypothetical protein
LNRLESGLNKADVEETNPETRTVTYQNTVSTLAVGKLRKVARSAIEEKPGQNPKVSSEWIKAVSQTQDVIRKRRNKS